MNYFETVVIHGKVFRATKPAACSQFDSVLLNRRRSLWAFNLVSASSILTFRNGTCYYRSSDPIKYNRMGSNSALLLANRLHVLQLPLATTNQWQRHITIHFKHCALKERSIQQLYSTDAALRTTSFQSVHIGHLYTRLIPWLCPGLLQSYHSATSNLFQRKARSQFQPERRVSLSLPLIAKTDSAGALPMLLLASAAAAVVFLCRFEGIFKNFNPSSSAVIPNDDMLSPEAPSKNLFNAILGFNLLILFGWQYILKAANSYWKEKISMILVHHFIGRIENITNWRIHVLFTCALSHPTVFHAFANLWMLFLLGISLQRSMTPLDVATLYTFSAIFSTAAQLCWSGGSCAGASAVVLAFLCAECSLNPRSWFQLLFPIPGMILTSTQLIHMTLFINFFFFIWTLNRPTSVAWVAHLVGLLCGYLFSLYKRYYCNDLQWGDILSHSKRYGGRDWFSSFLDIQDFFKSLHIRWKIFFSQSLLETEVLHKEYDRLKGEKWQRRKI